MTISVPPEFWKHKVQALLIPTPLATREPASEPERARELRRLLERYQLAAPECPELHTRAQQDAYRAHSEQSDYEAAAKEAGAVGLRHPLSGRLLGERPCLSGETWPEFVGFLEQVFGSSKDAKTVYLRLWRALLRPEERFGLAGVAGHAIFNDHTLLAHRSAAAALVGARCGGGEAALLHFHLGPVQSFIKAARRTHDLSLGSYMVAYLSFHAVQAIAEQLGPDAVLYPDLATLPLYVLERVAGDDEKRRQRAIKVLRASLPNRFMALVPADEVQAIAGVAAKAAVGAWKELAEAVRSGLCAGLEGSLAQHLGSAGRFGQQVAERLEIDVTWRPWTAGPDEGSPYAPVFCKVRDDLLAQRLLVTALPKLGAPVPKCTVCGEREQIGPDREFWLKLRSALDERFGPQGAPEGSKERGETIDLREGEALCAVCLCKRFANRWYFGGQGSIVDLRWDNHDDRVLLRFPSVASVASAPARRVLRQGGSVLLGGWNRALRKCHEQLGFTPPGNLLPGLGAVARTGEEFRDVDGTWLYESSYVLETALRDHDREGLEEESEALKESLQEGRKALGELLVGCGEVQVTPYYAVISLDVDRMGKWLDGRLGLTLDKFAAGLPKERRRITPALHREISGRQSALASDPLYEIVERRHLGRVIYSGGDDLLAFVPLATVWRCLAELRECFQSDEALGRDVTLSAGVAITHWRAPLSEALRLAREAEEEAKQERDCLVVKVDRRSGVAITHRAEWRLTALLSDPSCLSGLTEERAAEDERPRLNLRHCERLEYELQQVATLPEAKVALVFRRLMGRSFTEALRRDPLVEHVYVLCRGDDGDERRSVARRSACEVLRAGSLTSFLDLLRFLAREHDPVIAAAWSGEKV